jgi:hypothetical protein
MTPSNYCNLQKFVDSTNFLSKTFIKYREPKFLCLSSSVDRQTIADMINSSFENEKLTVDGELSFDKPVDCQVIENRMNEMTSIAKELLQIDQLVSVKFSHSRLLNKLQEI